MSLSVELYLERGGPAEHADRGDGHGRPLADPIFEDLPHVHQLGVAPERRRVQERPTIDAGQVDLHGFPRGHGRSGVLDLRQPEVTGQVVERATGHRHQRQPVLGRDGGCPAEGAVAPAGP